MRHVIVSFFSRNYTSTILSYPRCPTISLKLTKVYWGIMDERLCVADAKLHRILDVSVSTFQFYPKKITGWSTEKRLKLWPERIFPIVSLMDDVHLSAARHFRYELRRKIFSRNLERGRCAVHHKSFPFSWIQKVLRILIENVADGLGKLAFRKFFVSNSIAPKE